MENLEPETCEFPELSQFPVILDEVFCAHVQAPKGDVSRACVPKAALTAIKKEETVKDEGCDDFNVAMLPVVNKPLIGRGCWCNSDSCNNEIPSPRSTNKSGVNGLSWVLLLVVVVFRGFVIFC